MKARIQELKDFHPTGKPCRPSVCYMAGKYSREVRENIDKLHVPGIFIRNAVIMLPSGINDVPASRIRWTAARGLFTGKYQHNGWHFNESSWCIECLSVSKSKIKSEAKRISSVLRSPVIVKFSSVDGTELFLVEPVNAGIEDELAFLTPETKEMALSVLHDVDRNIRSIIQKHLEAVVHEPSARSLLMAEAYRRLLEIWPASKYTEEDIARAESEFRKIKPSAAAENTESSDFPRPFTIIHRRWSFLPSKEEDGRLDMGFADLGHENWQNITCGMGISPEAVAFIDGMSGYFENERRLSGVDRILQEEKSVQERGRILSGIFLNAWRERERILSTPSLYLAEIPECSSGTSFSGRLFMPLGAIVECWMNCPEFKTDDGRYVIRFASGLSGYTHGEAVSLSTGKISGFECRAGGKNSRRGLVCASAAYRAKAMEIIKSGNIPVRPERLLEELTAAGRKGAD